ncbi:MAG: metallophosphoesterase [Pirellulales bacterium]|nr:metallophosphoesterase [Pirellulales bacterium]
MSGKSLSRRDLLRRGAAMVAGTALAGASAGGVLLAEGSEANRLPARKQTLRFAHLTDVHVQPERAAGAGLAACLHHVQSHQVKPDVIFNGGDAIMDSLAASVDRTKLQWKLWHDTFRNECSLPVESCIGNHDVWGWDKKYSQASGSEPNFGKNWAVEALGISHRYRSFDRAGWHFVVLDSVHSSAKGLYEGRLDEEQFEWLADDLAKLDGKSPVCVLSHIPIFCVCVLVYSQKKPKESSFTVSGANIHIDALRIKDLFAKHANVKLCLSGHIHLTDRADYNGVTYLCNGAVCGAWWKGKNHECDAGYALVDLFDDGSFEHRYENYGWQARSA